MRKLQVEVYAITPDHIKCPMLSVFSLVCQIKSLDCSPVSYGWHSRIPLPPAVFFLTKNKKGAVPMVFIGFCWKTDGECTSTVYALSHLLSIHRTLRTWFFWLRLRLRLLVHARYLAHAFD